MNHEMILDLAHSVQHNCNISDARHGADYALCTYLMKMREYYRWEHRLPYDAALDKAQVGEWLQAREQLWQDLEHAELVAVEIDGERFDPFDAEGVNARLASHGLVYSGGLGNSAKPHFFLGDLESCTRHGDYAVFVSAREYARDLGAPPAMTIGHTIFLRRESLRRMLWEKLETWRWSRPDNALGRAFACYDFENAFHDSLEAMTDREINAALLHERGEFEAGLRLGEGWNEMLLDVAYTPAELIARAVRDHLADCLVTLPTLAQEADAPSLHFYMGNLSNMRKEIFPGLQEAYSAWLMHGDTKPFDDVAEEGVVHWEGLARDMIRLYRQSGSHEAADQIRELALTRRL